jgi:hypothetical protein
MMVWGTIILIGGMEILISTDTQMGTVMAGPSEIVISLKTMVLCISVIE